MEWQNLLDLIDYYSYSKKDEKVQIRDGENKEQAEQAYNHIVSICEIDKDVNDLWAFDIALDCVRRMSEEDREYIRNNTDTSLYHFDYAMGLRNEFIYGAKHHFVPMADDLSSRIMEMIFAILSPDYILE